MACSSETWAAEPEPGPEPEPGGERPDLGATGGAGFRSRRTGAVAVGSRRVNEACSSETVEADAGRRAGCGPLRFRPAGGGGAIDVLSMTQVCVAGGDYYNETGLTSGIKEGLHSVGCRVKGTDLWASYSG